MTKKTKFKGTCYRCGQPASSNEHFPPKCFFPKKSNLQLKTVRSCELHNNAKSHDDQYVLAHICVNAASGENLAKRVFLESIAPYLERSPKFHKQLIGKPVEMPNGTMAYPISIKRFDSFFDALTHAVCYDRFGQLVDEKLFRVGHTYLNLRSSDVVEEYETSLTRAIFGHFFDTFRSQIDRFEADKIDEVVYGNQIAAPSKLDGSVTVLHTFYGVFEVISRLTRKLA